MAEIKFCGFCMLPCDPFDAGEVIPDILENGEYSGEFVHVSCVLNADFKRIDGDFLDEFRPPNQNPQKPNKFKSR